METNFGPHEPGPLNSMEGVSNKDLLFFGALAVGAYFLWKTLSPVIGAAGTVASAIGSGVNATSGFLARQWVELTAGPSLNVLGTVQFPNGSQAQISKLPVRTDTQGNIYTQVNGITYQLQPWVPDAAGNPVYPAIAVGT